MRKEGLGERVEGTDSGRARALNLKGRSAFRSSASAMMVREKGIGKRVYRRGFRCEGLGERVSGRGFRELTLGELEH